MRFSRAARTVHGAAASGLFQRASDSSHAPLSHATPAARSAPTDVGQTVRLSGWVHRVRDHGGLLFIDLRDHYGLTQIVVDPDSPAFKAAERLRSEWVIRVDGTVKARDAGDRQPRPADRRRRGLRRRPSRCSRQAAELPMPVFGDQEYPEETRLTYRFLDLRRDRLHRNIMKRSRDHRRRSAGA